MREPAPVTDGDLVDDLHARRPGVTEDLLVHARDASGQTPYQAVVAGLGPGPVVDLCCGTAPVADLVGDRPYAGWDRSTAEVAEARRRRPGVDVRVGDVLAPGADGPAAWLAGRPEGPVQVVVAMALMLVPLEALLAEVSRWAPVGSHVRAVVPTRDPDRVGEAYGRLLALLGVDGTPFPEPLHDLAGRAASEGWAVERDRPADAVVPIATADDRARLAGSFYAASDGEAAVRAHLRALAAAGWRSHPYPLRHVVLRRAVRR